MRTRVKLVVAVIATLAQPGLASHDDGYDPVVDPSWETSADGGTVSDDVGRYAVASKSRNNGAESLFVTGVRAKPDALQAIGINDTDAVTSAFDAGTGEVRWTAAYDAGLDVFDSPSGMELDYNNNILHVVVDSGVDSAIVTYAVSSGSETNVTQLPAWT